MKKILLICMALVIALGALGVGYAAWTDTINITGTVNTGSVDIDAVYFSSSYIYKDLDNDGIATVFYVYDANGVLKWQSGTVPANPWLVAYGYAEPGATDDTVTVYFGNAFPYPGLVADFIVHYDGSVPAIVTADFDTPIDPMLAWLWDNGYVHVYGATVDITDDPENKLWDFEYLQPIEGPIQMHYCDYAKIWVFVDLPQADDAVMIQAGYTQADFMSKTWYFYAHITAIQWNEAP